MLKQTLDSTKNELTNLNSSTQSMELSISLLRDNTQLKFELDATISKIAKIAKLIDDQNLPNKITFSYVLLNWKNLSNLIANIISILR